MKGGRKDYLVVVSSMKKEEAMGYVTVKFNTYEWKCQNLDPYFVQ